MSSYGERSDEEDVLELIGVNENQDSNHGSGDELQGDQGEGFQPQNSDDNGVENAGQKVIPKGPKRAKSTVPRLTTERLKGPKGVHTIEKYFEGFKFYRKGREKEDLDRIMKRLEHWSYRLFPKLNFDDCLTKIEQLGTKKDLQVFLKKYRTDMITADDDIMRPELIDDDEDDKQEDSPPQEEFDLLLAEQIEKQRQKDVTVADTSAFDNLLAFANSQNQTQIQTPRKEPSSALSGEVKERIERNRRLALERKLATMKRLQALKMISTGDNQEASTNDQSKNNSTQKPSNGEQAIDNENNSERMEDDAEPIFSINVDNQNSASQNDSSKKVIDTDSIDLISSNLNSERMEEDIPISFENLIENQDPDTENGNKNIEAEDQMEDAVPSLTSS